MTSGGSNFNDFGESVYQISSVKQYQGKSGTWRTTRYFVQSKIFYRAAWNADSVYSDDNSVCPSVRCVYCDKTEERSVQIFYRTKDHLA